VNSAEMSRWRLGISRARADRDFWRRGGFGRDGFDDRAAGQFWIEGNSGAVRRGVHEGNDLGIVESGRAFEPNVTSNRAASLKAVLGTGLWEQGFRVGKR